MLPRLQPGKPEQCDVNRIYKHTAGTLWAEAKEEVETEAGSGALPDTSDMVDAAVAVSPLPQDAEDSIPK